jgi:agarase
VAAYNDAVKAKFGNQSAWADSVVSRIDSWKLNTLGAWADSVVITKGMPYTRALSLGKTSGPWLNGLFPDVFDPAWIASVDTKANSGCTPYRNDPTLIGYFLDNEVRVVRCVSSCVSCGVSGAVAHT